MSFLITFVNVSQAICFYHKQTYTKPIQNFNWHKQSWLFVVFTRYLRIKISHKNLGITRWFTGSLQVIIRYFADKIRTFAIHLHLIATKNPFWAGVFTKKFINLKIYVNKQKERESGRRKNGGAVGLLALRFCPLSFCERFVYLVVLV